MKKKLETKLQEEMILVLSQEFIPSTERLGISNQSGKVGRALDNILIDTFLGQVS
jgi:hypothetical protein